MIQNLSFSKLIDRYPVLSEQEPSIIAFVNSLVEAVKDKKNIWMFGNGGSAADAEHFSGELTKSFINKRKLTSFEINSLDSIDSSLKNYIHGGIGAISLSSQLSSITAFSNDVDYKFALAQLVWSVAREGDVAIGISTSGNSENVYRALQVAKAKGLKTIILTGSKDSRGGQLCDINVRAPSAITHEVQELHLPIYHAVCLELENYFWKQ